MPRTIPRETIFPGSNVWTKQRHRSAELPNVPMRQSKGTYIKGAVLVLASTKKKKKSLEGLFKSPGNGSLVSDRSHQQALYTPVHTSGHTRRKEPANGDVVAANPLHGHLRVGSRHEPTDSQRESRLKPSLGRIVGLVVGGFAYFLNGLAPSQGVAFGVFQVVGSVGRVYEESLEVLGLGPELGGPGYLALEHHGLGVHVI